MFLGYWANLTSPEKRRRYYERMNARGKTRVVFLQGVLGCGTVMFAVIPLCNLLMTHALNRPATGAWFTEILMWAAVGWFVGHINWAQCQRFLRSNQGLPANPSPGMSTI